VNRLIQVIAALMVVMTISLVATYSRVAVVERELHESRAAIELLSLEVQSNRVLIRTVHNIPAPVLPADAK
jgi:hypothetical protein